MVANLQPALSSGGVPGAIGQTFAEQGSAHPSFAELCASQMRSSVESKVADANSSAATKGSDDSLTPLAGEPGAPAIPRPSSNSKNPQDSGSGGYLAQLFLPAAVNLPLMADPIVRPEPAATIDAAQASLTEAVGDQNSGAASEGTDALSIISLSSVAGSPTPKEGRGSLSEFNWLSAMANHSAVPSGCSALPGDHLLPVDPTDQTQTNADLATPSWDAAPGLSNSSGSLNPETTPAQSVPVVNLAAAQFGVESTDMKMPSVGLGSAASGIGAYPTDPISGQGIERPQFQVELVKETTVDAAPSPATTRRDTEPGSASADSGSPRPESRNAAQSQTPDATRSPVPPNAGETIAALPVQAPLPSRIRVAVASKRSDEPLVSSADSTQTGASFLSSSSSAVAPATFARAADPGQTITATDLAPTPATISGPWASPTSNSKISPADPSEKPSKGSTDHKDSSANAPVAVTAATTPGIDAAISSAVASASPAKTSHLQGPDPQTIGKNRTGSAAVAPSVPDPPAPPGPGSVQMARMVSKAAQAEMRIGLNTQAFGSVEVRTSVHSNDVGVVIGSERGDLRSLMTNDLPGIASNLQQQNLRLNQVSFQQQGFAFASDSSSAGDSQARSFVPQPAVASGLFSEPFPAESVTSPELPIHGSSGLSILA